MKRSHVRGWLVGALMASVLLAPIDAQANRQRQQELAKGVTIKDRLGKYIPLQLPFTDHKGTP